MHWKHVFIVTKETVIEVSNHRAQFVVSYKLNKVTDYLRTIGLFVLNGITRKKSNPTISYTLSMSHFLQGRIRIIAV